jgi:hypothetical protein
MSQFSREKCALDRQSLAVRSLDIWATPQQGVELLDTLHIRQEYSRWNGALGAGVDSRESTLFPEPDLDQSPLPGLRPFQKQKVILPVRT